jgi:hypothetical protein
MKRSMLVMPMFLLATIVVTNPLSAEQPIGAPNAQFEEIGCNRLEVGSQIIYWTSAFASSDYVVTDPPTMLQVTVTWDGSVCAIGGDSSPTCRTLVPLGVRLRGDGFSPGGVQGTEPRLIGTTATSATFEIAFTRLHQPGNKPEGKGNAQILLDVQVDQNCDGVPDTKRSGEPATTALGVNVHVLTGPDQP